MKIISEKLCCGCGNCANTCSLEAIRMKLDDEGFLYPIIDDNKCVDCGLCREVCPIINVASLQIESHNLKTFCGYYLDKNKLLSCSSGGAASAISEKIIELGGVVYGT
jgi:formate hydrogenlyase subunit 6/NADH:ubiquinone oxidoreductase subunit I